MPLPKRFYDSIDSLPEKIETFDDCRWMLPDKNRILENGRPHGLIWMQPAEAEFLWDCVKERPPRTNLAEIGRCEGGSTIIIGSAKEPEAAFVSVDIDPVDDEQLAKMIDRFEIKNTFLGVGDSHTWPAQDLGDIGLLLIDGDHSHEAIRKDFDNWWPMVCPGGMCLMHDVNPDGLGGGPWAVYREAILRDDVEPIKAVQTLALIRKKPRRKHR